MPQYEDPAQERRRVEHARKALALLTTHVIEEGPGPMTLDLIHSLIVESVEEGIDTEDDAVQNTATRLMTGMTYIAWELLVLREKETGQATVETLDELGRVFNTVAE